jgi:hypothetical protein
VSDELPREIVFLGSSAGGKLDGNVVRWNIGTIPAGQTREVTLDVSAKLAGDFDNRCTATADGGWREQGKAMASFVK